MPAETPNGTSLPLARPAPSSPAGPPPEVVALFGPTGVGKTGVAIALADLLRVRGERPVAISADALQVYEGIETLTGAATATERARLEHRLLSFVPLDSEFSVGEFMPLAHAEIDAALASGRRPIVLGGTGLYLRAALTDLSLKPPPPPEVRAGIEAELAARGAVAMHAQLAERAPAAAAAIEPGDRSRIVRALELAELGALDDQADESQLWTAPDKSQLWSALDVEPDESQLWSALDVEPDESQLWSAETRRPTLLFGLVMDREQLYRRINARVDAMVGAGAADEARRADERGASRTARKALGLEDLLNGDPESMKRRTRNYAKRQLTWMRKLAGIRLIDVTGRAPVEVAAEIARALA
jgi:tRNA dimethylallyltransferase